MINMDLHIDLSVLDMSEDQLGRMAYVFGTNLGRMSHTDAASWLNRIIEIARILGRRELQFIPGAGPRG